MKNRTKSLFTAAALIAMSSMCVSGCTPKNVKPLPVGNEDLVLEAGTQKSLNIFLLDGKVVDQYGAVNHDFVLSKDGDVLDISGETILHAAEEVREYPYSCEVSLKSQQVLRQKVNAAVNADQQLHIDPKTFSFNIHVSISGGIENEISIESPDPGALYFPWDQNLVNIDETSEAPPDNALPELHIRPDTNGNAVITATMAAEGKYPVVVRDVYGKICNIFYFEASPNYYQEMPEDSGVEESAEGEEHAHRLTQTKVEASESRQGYTEHHCEECGFTYRDHYVSTLECQHKYEEKAIPSTYTTAGYKIYTCELCGDSYIDEEIPPLICQHEETTDTIVAPTCMKPGYTLHECNVCRNHEYKDQYTSPTGHSWDNGRVTLRPTCADSGEKTYTCKVCKATRTEEIEATGKHRYIPVITRQTCTEKGFTTYTCSVCGDSYVDNYTDPFGHKKTLTWSVTKRATCGESGLKEGVCPWCGETLQTEEIPATGRHNYHVSIVPPTETSEGYTEHTCVICGEKYKDNIKPETGN